MNLIPFGEVYEDRVKLSKDYNLIEMIGGIWRLTQKARNNYDPISYIYYLRGSIDKPKRITANTNKKEVEDSMTKKSIEDILSI